MKKLLSLTMAFALAATLLTGCGCSKQEDTANEDVPTEAAVPGNEEAPAEGGQAPADDAAPAEGNSAPAENQPAPERPAVSENKEVVTKEQAPKVFLIQNPDSGTDTLTYHLENCKLGEGNEMQEVSWEMVQTIGFWQCPECNPPRYEDYKNAE